MAPAKRGIRYQPDPIASPAKLLEVINDSGLTMTKAADAIGIEAKRLNWIIEGKDAFPPLPEFVLVVSRALPSQGTYRRRDPREFPGVKDWADANPEAMTIADYLADRMLGRYAGARGRGGQKSSRQELFEALRAQGAVGSDYYWNQVMAGRSSFPKDPAKRRIIEDVVGRSLDEKPSKTPVPLKKRATEEIRALCLVAEAGAWVYGEADPDLRRSLIRQASQCFRGPRDELAPVLKAIRDGRKLEEIALQANVRLEPFVALMLGLNDHVVPAEEDAIIRAVRKVLNLENPIQPLGNKRRPARRLKRRRQQG